MPPIASHGLPSFILIKDDPRATSATHATHATQPPHEPLTTNALNLLTNPRYQPPQPPQPTIYIYITHTHTHTHTHTQSTHPACRHLHAKPRQNPRYRYPIPFTLDRRRVPDEQGSGKGGLQDLAYGTAHAAQLHGLTFPCCQRCARLAMKHTAQDLSLIHI